MIEKIQIERIQIGYAFLPRKGVFPISEVRNEFQSAPFCYVYDMDGIRHQVHRNSISLKPLQNENQDPAV